MGFFFLFSFICARNVSACLPAGWETNICTTNVKAVLTSGSLEGSGGLLTFSLNPDWVGKLRFPPPLIFTGVNIDAAGYFYHTVHKQLRLSRFDKLAGGFTTRVGPRIFLFLLLQGSRRWSLTPEFFWSDGDLLLNAVMVVIVPLCSFLSVFISSSVLSTIKQII